MAVADRTAAAAGANDSKKRSKIKKQWVADIVKAANHPDVTSDRITSWDHGTQSFYWHCIAQLQDGIVIYSTHLKMFVIGQLGEMLLGTVAEALGDLGAQRL